MTTKELYVKDAKVWVPHGEKVWESAILLEDYKSEKSSSTLRIKTEETKQLKTLKIESDDDLPPLCNPEILVGENNLTSLSFLHEPAVLYNLQIRFQRHSIYTYCGIVLVAFNPYHELPIYGNDTIWAYRGQAMGDLEPHIFAVAEEAYTKLERESHDQSIIVSGESGAGKTVSAKYAMRYFATVGGSSKETQVEKKVLSSSPIMEAIGNAKTTRNDNSSRFGKFIEIQFNKNYHIIGASMRTYLLEKSRVVFQASDERNYHIFYQMCAASKRMPHLHLAEPREFHYLNQGDSPLIDGVDDLASFEETSSALTVLGFSSKQQDDMFRILAAILHLGNVGVRKEGEGCGISPSDKHLLTITELLGVDVKSMRKWLCHRKIVSMREVILKPMNVDEAIGARDALAKHIYAELFSWIVERINVTLQSPSKAQCFIGVLDIYGFETFEINSFEQFCINYANEKLQQQFNQHVFKLEQEEYLKEEIEWTFIDFYDNQPCIDLIESKLGILDLLDDECRMPKGSDNSWAEKLYAECVQSKHFEKPRFGTSAFLINHFADKVQYETMGFLDKNRDTVVEEQIQVLKECDNGLLKKIFSEDNQKLVVPNIRLKISPSKPVSPNSKQNKRTVGTQFRDSLNMLMSTLNATTPHYVRCIKPNDTKEAFEYNPVRAVQQLRACGVLETIRISAAGFPSQRTYGDFFQRYRCLCRFKDINRNDLRETTRRILAVYIKDSDKFKFGKTKVLFRAGQVAYLEKLRAEKLRNACIMIQKTVRGYMQGKRYRVIRRSILGLQRHGRGYLARKRAQEIRENRAATKIQAHVRGWLVRRRYQHLKLTCIGLQRYARGLLARRRFKLMKDHASAVRIQRFVRGYLARRACRKKLRNIIIVQSCVRRRLAKKVFKSLKAEARSVEHVKSLNKGLENKIISLQHKINELAKENQNLKAAHQEVSDLKIKLEGHKALENENKRLNGVLAEREKEFHRKFGELKNQHNEQLKLIEMKDEQSIKKDQNIARLLEENEKLRGELSVSQEKIIRSEQGVENDLKSRLEREKNLLILDQDQDRGAYQRLLLEYQELEQRAEIMEQRLAVLEPGRHSRSLSDASSGSGPNANTEISHDDHNIDYGYGSVRSTASSGTLYSRVETIDWNQRCPDSPQNGLKSPKETNGIAHHHQIDVGLVLKLQQKLKDVERENGRLIRMVEELERDSPDDLYRTQETYKLQELELENSRLRKDLSTLRKSLADSDSSVAPKTLVDQFVFLEEELERKKEEIHYLQRALAESSEKVKSRSLKQSRDPDSVNEDGEISLAFEAQKKINRQLEEELQAKEKEWKEVKDEWRAEIDRLQDENLKQRKLLTVDLSRAPQTQTEAYMQLEITRLTSENLDLQEKFDRVADENRKLKKQFKVLARRLKDAGYVDSSFKVRVYLTKSTVPDNADSGFDLDSSGNSNSGSLMPAIRKKEREFEGMFEFKKEDINVLIRNLVVELSPTVAITLLPGLPAYILFMCIRHTDFINEDEKVRLLLTNYLNTVKRVISNRPEDFESCVLWLANTLRLLHNMKQYSGDKPFQLENTPRQNEQCLRNFDLSEYRVVLGNVALKIYTRILTILKERVQPLTVPSLLEHEAISGLTPAPNNNRSRSNSETKDAESTQAKLNKLLQELTAVHKTLLDHGVDPEIIVQVFKQLFYFMCASALNNLLLRNDLCHWAKGMQIRYNLSHLEQWARDQRPVVTTDALQPLVQAAHLLQARKNDEDVESICEICDKLTVNQIVKILNLYTPADEYETRVPVSFIRKVQAKLQERGEHNDQLLMDVKFSYTVRFPFNPSNIRLEDIEVPEVLSLPMIKKV